MSEPSNTTPAPPTRKNWGWLGYFLFLIVASVGVTIFMIMFNLRIQLKPEELEAAHKLWKENGPKSYDMVYKKKLGVINAEDVFAVKVRNGKVESVRMNDAPLKRNKDQDPDQDPRIYFSMDAIFHDIERFMDLDQRNKDAKVYVVANFDPKTGAVIKYTRYDMRSKDRVEMNIILTAVADR
jgi:hypothetical protein